MAATLSKHRKRQRLVVVSLGLVALIASTAIILFGLAGDSLNAFLRPSEAVERPLATGDRLRLGGLVKDGSITRDVDGITIRFVVTDCAASVKVSYNKIPPALFAEGEGVITEGVWQADGSLKADRLLAKHDENYAPPGMLPESTDGCEGSYGPATAQATPEEAAQK